ncbi:glycoside hydrolase family 20 protein [Fluviicola chungangensis]|uniref:beta-N-acetylhexosaminidase n=1 Tax=Fluviicola chungangensis TaxID=2597671 RepID=A0A556N309_9FLAO|nr:family 20 glycosylhydrolase [Fluviicola chungangensis]TSJ46584.1 family 20 glycosylhydrolase [Fluviicola chungangensis]
MKITLVILLFFFTTQLSAQHSLVFPEPVNVEQTTDNFVFNGLLTVDNTRIPSDLFSYLRELFGRQFIHLEPASAKDDATIRLKQVQTFAYTEGYQLSVTHTGIEIQYSSYASLCNAFQTLNQLIQNPKELAGIRISDQPAFAYRGVHLDCSRHFFSIGELRKFIDQLAKLKFNRFHWHLTDDQGWRIEIKKYPKLTSVGAWRDSTLIGHFSKQPAEWDHTKYGGFYTQEEARQLVEYARIRGIEIIPEIEMPGHARAALAAYPELSCTEKQLPVAGTWGVFDDVFCSQEKTRTFLKDVLDEIIELFPSQVIHIGGDECPKINWEKCPKCKAVMTQNHLNTTHELQSFFIQDIEKHVNAKGRTIIGWDEILEGGLAPNAQVMSWQGMEGGIAAAKQKHRVVMTPTSYCYFDYYQSGHPSEPLAIGGYLPLEKVYRFDPIKGVEDEYKQYILGGQANLWTEYLPTIQSVEYNAFPRLVAMAEVLWNKSSVPYSDFVEALSSTYLPQLRNDGVRFSTSFLDPTLQIRLSKSGAGYDLIKPVNDVVFSVNNEIVNGIDIERTDQVGEHRYLIHSNIGDQELRVCDYTFTSHLALGKTVRFDTQPHEKYNHNGNLGLTDGVVGKKPWKGNEWLGFNEDTVRFTLDLEELTSFRTIRIETLNDPGSWIYRPEKYVIQVSSDGKKFKTVAKSKLTGDVIRVTKKMKARYVKVTIYNNEFIPQGQTGAGFTPWTFINELILTK